MGLRQLRHPVQGVRHPGHPAHGRGEDRRRGHRAPVHRPGAVRGAAHPVGPGRRLRRAADLRRGAGRRARHHQLQHLPGRRLQARRADPHRRQDPAEGDRPPLRVHRRHARDRLAGPQDLAGRGLELPGAGRHARPAGPAGREPGGDLRAAARRTSGWCSSTSSSSRRSTTPTCPTGARRTPRSPPSATAPWSASTPATTRPGPTSSSSSPSCSGSGSSARSTSTAASTPTTT